MLQVYHKHSFLYTGVKREPFGDENKELPKPVDCNLAESRSNYYRNWDPGSLI